MVVHMGQSSVASFVSAVRLAAHDCLNK